MFIVNLDKELGNESGFLLVMENAKQYHKSLIAMTDNWGYYPPANKEQAALLNNCIYVQELDISNNNVIYSRCQFYCIRKETASGADNGRFILMIPPGLAPFQPCEFLFGTRKGSLYRLTFDSEASSSSMHGKRVALENIIRSTTKNIIRVSLRTAEHFREAWLARDQNESSGGTLLPIETVEELVI